MGVFPVAGPWITVFSTVATLVPLVLIARAFDAFGDKRWMATFGLARTARAVWLATTNGELA
jgi:hypothetical protein